MASFSSRPLRLTLLAILTCAEALRVTPGSSCSSVCGDTTTTNSSGIVCSDFDYYSTSAGSTFMNCLECLQTSNATSDSENDVSWFLYNLRYASAVCLYDFPSHNLTNSTKTCDLEYACEPLQGALEYGNLDPSNRTEFGYCAADSNALYGSSINNCVSCLHSSPSTYTANFLMALEAGCQQEPEAGTLLAISGNMFSTTAVNITVADTAVTSSSSSSNNSNTVLSLTAIIGISVGLGVLFLLAAALFTLYFCRQRRYDREDAAIIAHLGSPYSARTQRFYLAKSGGGPGSGGTGFAMQQYNVDCKSGHSTFDEDDSPLTEPLHRDHKTDFSSNAEYYDRLEGKSRGRPLQSSVLPLRSSSQSNKSVASADVDSIGNLPSHSLPTHPAYIPRTMTPGQLGGRASRNESRSASIRSSAQSSLRGQDRSSSEQRPAQRVASKFSANNNNKNSSAADNKPPSYAMEVYLDARDEEQARRPTPEPAAARRVPPYERPSSRVIEVQLAGPVQHEQTLRSQYQQQQQAQQQEAPKVPPPAVSWRSRRASVSPSRQAAAVTPPDRAATATPATMSSLILPTVPKIRVPGKKPPRLQITEATPPSDGTAGANARKLGISGPLAFPDSRFSTRPTNESDRIIEQTVVDRNGQVAEVPIASGKSYLYG